MPNPLVSSVHIDSALTSMSVAYVQERATSVARAVMPVVNVNHRSDKYFTYNKADFMRDEARLRAPGTESAGSDYRMGSATYTCERYALHKDVADEIRLNADPAVDPERDATEFLTQKMLIREDRAFAADFMKTGVWDNDKNGAGGDFTQWSVTSTTIASDVRNWSDTVQKATGYRPNTLCVGADVWTVMINNGTLLDRIRYTERGILTTDLVAALLGLDKIVVADTVYESAAEGATSAMAYAIGDSTATYPECGLLTYTNPTPSVLKPSAGYTFSWSPFADAQGGAVMKSFPMVEKSADRIEAEMYWDQKAVSSSCGLFFYNAIA